MGLGTYFKSKFKKDTDVPSTEQFYTPLRVALHSTISIDSVDMITLGEALHPKFVSPSGDCEVLAIGTINFDGTQVYQLYLQDSAYEEFILQVVEGKEHRTGDATVDEVTLYKQVVTIEPETETALERVLNDIGFTDIELDGVKYERMWGDQYTEKLDFRTFKETVVTPTGTVYYTDNYILYGRPIRNIVGDEITENLLVGLEENENEAQIMMQLGLQLNVNDIKVQ